MKRGRPIGSRERHGSAIAVERRLWRGAVYRMFCLAFGLRLRQLLVERDVSCAELAAAIQVNHMTVLAWQRGRAVPSVPALIAVARSLSCSLVDLLPEGAHHVT